MSEPIRNFARPTSDGRLALENHLLAVAQSAATRAGKVPDLRDVSPALSLQDQFASVFGVRHEP